MPRPNAGGGRRNQNQPVVPARARFSNWKPPSKKHNKAARESGSEKSYQLDASNTVKRSNGFDEKLPSYVDLSTIETIGILPSALLQLDLLLSSTSNMELDIKLDVQVAPSAVALNVATKSSTSNSLLPTALPTTQSKLLSPEEKRVVKNFLSLGFSEKEIRTALQLLKLPTDEDDIFLSLLFVVRCMDLPQRSTEASRYSERNDILSEELETLNCIYGDNFSAVNILVLGQACCKICLSIQVNASSFDSPPNASVVLYIINPSSYPVGKAWSLMGWVSSDSLEPEKARELTFVALDYITADRTGEPIIFDFVQHFQSICPISVPNIDTKRALPSAQLTEKIGVSLPPAPPILPDTSFKSSASNSTSSTSSPRPTSFRANPQQREFDQSVDDAAARKARLALPVATAAATKAAIAPAACGSQVVLGAPGTRLTDSPEYRTAFTQALNMGLAGQEARDHVSAWPSAILLRLFCTASIPFLRDY